jgi:hypothetical protein
MIKFTRKIVISVFLLAVVGLAFASKGGGGGKKAATKFPFKNTFTPIRTTTGFTLKAGPSFSGSYFLSQEKTGNTMSFNTISTYQKGNTIFVLPYKYKVTTSPYLDLSGKNNLQVFDLKIRMHK